MMTQNRLAVMAIAVGVGVMGGRAEAQWLSGYQFRKSLAINAGSGAGTGYQVQVRVGESSGASAFDLHVENHALNFPNDVRFTDDDGSTELGHWLESTTGTTPNRTATFWLKVNDNLDSAQSIWVYYYKSAGASGGSGDATFSFFDDFPGAAIDGGKWTIDDITGWSVTGGELRGQNSNGRIRSQTTFSSGVILETKYRTVSRPGNGCTPLGFYVSSGDCFGWLNHPGGDWMREDSTWTSIANECTVPVIARITARATQVDFYVYRQDTGAAWHNYANRTKTLTNGRITLGNRYDDAVFNQAYDAYWDWIRVRKYAATVPALGVSGAEQSASLMVTVTAPANGQQFLPGSSVTATVTVLSGTSPYYVSFFADTAGGGMVQVGTTQNGPGPTFTQTLGTPPIGTYHVYAGVTDSATPTPSTATSATNTFTGDGSPPTLAGSDIVDNKGGGPVPMYWPVTYTVTFSEDMDASTVSADDFGNAGSATYTLGAVTETSPGVFSVPVTPTSSGTLQLKVNAGAELKDVAGNLLNTASELVDDTTLTVTGTLLSWDANGAGANQTDGDGTWLNASQWWNGVANATWNNGTPDDATIGNGGNGGTITLGTVTAGTVTLGGFSGAYTLSSGSLTQSGGITISSGNVTINSTIGGAGGLSKAGSGLLMTTSTANNYTGKTLVSGGILQIGNGWGNSWASGTLPGGSNLEINDGTVAVWYYSGRNLGAGPGEIQLTGGTCGFAMKQADAGGAGWTINGSAAYEVVWGIPTFNPSVLLLSDAAAGPSRDWRFVNKIDLNGTNRTVSVTSTSYAGQMEGAIRNTGATPAGIIKMGPGELRLTAVNTYDGDTTVSEGTLQLNAVNPSNDLSTVRIASGAKLNLNFSGTDTIYTLFVGGTQMSFGLYGHTNSGADNGELGVGALDAYFGAGAGKLFVTLDITTPTLAPADIVDDKYGGPVVAGARVTYTVTFSEDMDASTVSAADFGNAGTATYAIDPVTETSPGVFTVPVTATGVGTLQLKVNADADIRDAAGTALDTASAIADDTVIDVTATDTTPPRLAGSGIVHDRSGGPVVVGTRVTYTVTFNEDMDEATVSAADFGNAGTATFTIAPVTETAPNSGVFTVPVTATGAGTLQLQINALADLRDVAGNAMDTSSAIADDATLTVDGTPPTLAGSAIVDDQGGGPVYGGTRVTYTVAFSEDMDASTVTAADFGNAGGTACTIGTVTETSPGVFSVPVTPTSDGTLQLQVNAAAELKDVAGNALDTASAIVDDTAITVIVLALTWDANGAGANQTDGGGAWLNPNQWWDGAANLNWRDGSRATIGNAGAGDTITLGAVMANSVTFTNFSGTYTLSGGSLTQSGGIMIGATSGNVTIHSTIGGAGGLSKAGSGLLMTTSTANNYTGKTLVSGGILQIGNGWGNSWASGTLPGGSNLELNGGTVSVYYYSGRNLGAGPGEIQLTGGTCGFAMKQGDAGGAGWTINGSAAYEVVWGIPTFNPSVLLLSDAAAGPSRDWRFVNKIDLNGTNRTLSVTSTSYAGQMEGLIRNTGALPAGIIKIGPGEMRLTAANTYDGDTTVSEGTLQLNVANPSNDLSTVTIAASGAKLTLTFAGSDTVSRLFIGAAQVRMGEYGHTTSGATNGGLGVGALDAYLSGPGRLIVQESPPQNGMTLIVR